MGCEGGEGRMRGRREGGMLGVGVEVRVEGGGVVGESGEVGRRCSSGERPLKRARKRDDWASR